MRNAAWVILGVSAVILVAGCEHRVTPSEVERVLTKRYSTPMSGTYEETYSCRQGERDWLAICQVERRSTPIGIRQGLPSGPVEKRVGVWLITMHRGEPMLATEELPNQGPIPSRDELHAIRAAKTPALKRQADEYAAKSKERLMRELSK